MDVVFAPHRMDYLKSDKKKGCVFCKDDQRDDALVVFEGTGCYVTMNKYPYTSGHLMIIPYRHISQFCDLSDTETAEMMALTRRSLSALTDVFSPEGFNIGMNVGKAAGAGVDEHIHLHVVPRWSGDTNFSTVVGEFRVIPEDLVVTRNTLAERMHHDKEE